MLQILLGILAEEIVDWIEIHKGMPDDQKLNRSSGESLEIVDKSVDGLMNEQLGEHNMRSGISIQGIRKRRFGNKSSFLLRK